MIEHRDPILYLDCTSATRSGLNTGVQRVVRNLTERKDYFTELLAINCVPICYQFNDFYPANIADQLSEESIGEHQPIEFRYRDIYLCIDAFWTMDMHSWYPFIKDRGASIGTLVYDLIPITHPEHCTLHEQEDFKDALNTAIEYSELLLCISRSTFEALQDYCTNNHISLDNKKLAVVPLAPALPKPPCNVHTTTSNTRLPQRDYFLAVGTLESRRGYLRLLQEFSSYWSSGGKDALLLIGKEGSTAGPISAQVKAFQHDGKPAYWLNDANDIELYSAYKQAKAIICPSYVEGYGMSVAEGLMFNGRVMANRLPVFGEYAGSLPYYFDIDNEGDLARLLRNATSLAPAKHPVHLGSWPATVEAISLELSKLGIFYGSTNAIELYRNTPEAIRWTYWLHHRKPCSSADIKTWLRFKNVFGMYEAFQFELRDLGKPLTVDFIKWVILVYLGKNDTSPDEIEFWKENCKNGKDLIERLQNVKYNLDAPLDRENIQISYLMFFGRDNCSPDEINYWINKKISLGEFRQILLYEAFQQAKESWG